MFYHTEEHLIELKIVGDLTLEMVKRMTLEFIDLAGKHNCPLLLNDCREARLKMSASEIFKVHEIMAEAASSLGLNVHRLKRAVVVSNDVEWYRFFENVTVNRGQNTRIFHDIGEAKQWLQTVPPVPG
jgi:hypothetical protein